MLLAIAGIGKKYWRDANPVQALDDVSLDIDSGELVVVRGPSGCGKSTLLLTAGGLLSPDAGKVLVEDRDLYALSSEERARFRADRIGFIFQQFHLIPYLDVFENVLAPSLAGSSTATRDRARELIARFGLEERLHHTPAQLSTGERQRTALARALLNRPALLLADEPTGNLDERNAEVVLEHLAEFARSGGGVLLVTHDAQAVRHAGRTIHLENGKLRPSGEEN